MPATASSARATAAPSLAARDVGIATRLDRRCVSAVRNLVPVGAAYVFIFGSAIAVAATDIAGAAYRRRP
jgi:hypothetical protein